MNFIRTHYFLRSDRWGNALYLGFAAAQIIAGIVFFFAYNWNALPDVVKIALPQFVLICALGLWRMTRRGSALSDLAICLALMMVGVTMGVVGQVFQLGADPWKLFFTWALVAWPLTILLRRDILFAIAVIISTFAWFLFVGQQGRGIIEDNIAILIYTAIIACLLGIREYFADTPHWLRLMALMLVFVPMVGPAMEPLINNTNSLVDIILIPALFITSAIIFVFYTRLRPDRLARTLALFASAVWVTAAGLRLIWAGMASPEFGGFVVLFLFSAIWVVACTAGFRSLLEALEKQLGARIV